MARSAASVFGLIGKKLRAELEDTKDEALPKRWIDLIRHLDKQESQKPDALPAEPPASSRRGRK